MGLARIVILVVALVAAGAAAFMVRNLIASRPTVAAAPAQNLPPPVQLEEVLVAASDVPMGKKLTAGDLRWQEWPEENLGPDFVTKSRDRDAVEQLSGAIVRNEIFKGEPINPNKLARIGDSSFMTVLVGPGLRAFSLRISPETGAGGFILPGDRVDVLLTRRVRDEDGDERSRDVYATETVLGNVRVLAIDQTLSEVNGNQVVVGKTATLELTPRQAELLALSEAYGDISLTLRPLADLVGDDGAKRENLQPITLTRLGEPTEAPTEVVEEVEAGPMAIVKVIRSGTPSNVITDRAE